MMFIMIIYEIRTVELLLCLFDMKWLPAPAKAYGNTMRFIGSLPVDFIGRKVLFYYPIAAIFRRPKESGSDLFIQGCFAK